MSKFSLSTLCASILTSVLLQGCGSSSSGEVSLPEAPVERTFSLSAKLTNECGVSSAFTDVELLLQDDSWQTLSTHKPDENGVISFVTENEFINYTLVAKDQKGSEAEGLNVVSYFQASSDIAASYQGQFDTKLDNSTCECLTENLSLTHRPFTSQTAAASSSSFTNWQAIDDKTTLFEEVRVCRNINGDWPLHSFSVSGLDSNGNAIASSDFIDFFDDEASTNGDGGWFLSAFQVAESIELTLPHQEFTTNQLIGNTAHFSKQVAEEVESLLIFDTHSYISESFYQSQASVTFTESSSRFGSSMIKTHHQVISTRAEESFLVKASEVKPQIDDINFSEIEADSSYDYSAVANFPMAIISFTYTAFNPDTQLVMPASWTFYGPIQGMLADSAELTGYSDIINIDTDIKTTEIRLMKSSTSGLYQDYIQYYQAGNTVDFSMDESNDFVKDLQQVEINITVN